MHKTAKLLVYILIAIKLIINNEIKYNKMNN